MVFDGGWDRISDVPKGIPDQLFLEINDTNLSQPLAEGVANAFKRFQEVDLRNLDLPINRSSYLKFIESFESLRGVGGFRNLKFQGEASDLINEALKKYPFGAAGIANQQQLLEYYGSINEYFSNNMDTFAALLRGDGAESFVGIGETGFSEFASKKGLSSLFGRKPKATIPSLDFKKYEELGGGIFDAIINYGESEITSLKKHLTLDEVAKLDALLEKIALIDKRAEEIALDYDWPDHIERRFGVSEGNLSRAKFINEVKKSIALETLLPELEVQKINLSEIQASLLKAGKTIRDIHRRKGEIILANRELAEQKSFLAASATPTSTVIQEAGHIPTAAEIFEADATELNTAHAEISADEKSALQEMGFVEEAGVKEIIGGAAKTSGRSAVIENVAEVAHELPPAGAIPSERALVHVPSVPVPPLKELVGGENMLNTAEHVLDYLPDGSIPDSRALAVIPKDVRLVQPVQEIVENPVANQLKENAVTLGKEIEGLGRVSFKGGASKTMLGAGIALTALGAYFVYNSLVGGKKEVEDPEQAKLPVMSKSARATLGTALSAVGIYAAAKGTKGMAEQGIGWAKTVANKIPKVEWMGL